MFSTLRRSQLRGSERCWNTLYHPGPQVSQTKSWFTLGKSLPYPGKLLFWEDPVVFCHFWLLAFAGLAGLACLASKVRTKTFRFCERINSKSSKVALAMRLVPAGLSRFGHFGSGFLWDGHRNLQCYRLLCVRKRSCGRE